MPPLLALGYAPVLDETVDTPDGKLRVVVLLGESRFIELTEAIDPHPV